MGMFDDVINLFKRRRNYTGDDYEEEENDTENFGFAQAIARKDYDNQELNFFSDVSRSDFLPGLIAMINTQKHLTENFKRSLVVTSAALCGVDLLLANNNPTQVGKEPIRNNLYINQLEAEIALSWLVTNATKSDLSGFDLAGFTRILRTNFKALQSRTIGKDRERVIMTELKTTMRGISEHAPREPKPPEKKKGLFGF